MMVPSMMDSKATEILAKSLFKELRGNGYSANQILGLTTELIDLVTKDLRQTTNAAAAADEASSRASA
jgi:DNA-binding ferritin-like protein